MWPNKERFFHFPFPTQVSMFMSLFAFLAADVCATGILQPRAFPIVRKNLFTRRGV